LIRVLLESTAFIFRNNHREFKITPTDSTLLVKYLIPSLVKMRVKIVHLICKIQSYRTYYIKVHSKLMEELFMNSEFLKLLVHFCAKIK